MWTGWICAGSCESEKTEEARAASSRCFEEAELVPGDNPARCHCREATLGEILADPIVTALMQADGVEPEEIKVMLRQIVRRPSGARPTQSD